MAVRRISELDKVTDESIQNPSTGPDVPFSKFIFETSEFNGSLDDNAPYFVSKQMTWEQLSSLIVGNLWQEISNLKARVDSLEQQIDGGGNALAILQKWNDYGIPSEVNGQQWTIKQIDNIDSIHCGNLTVDNDINGCALSAKWA
jgi:hypothetical protein